MSAARRQLYAEAICYGPFMPPSSSSRSAHHLRIIGGSWRGRRLPVPPVAGLRPTPDRVRETLFNWLTPTITGARCLDLYAGTGALGFEALSRGAAHVVFVERHRQAVAGLHQLAAALGADCEVFAGTVSAFLAETTARFDVIFMDPPYDMDPGPVCRGLNARLTAAGLVYVERGSAEDLRALAAWGRFSKRGRAGAVHFGLLQLDGDAQAVVPRRD
jgi:16S rRNA (guanine966-N2)-methyltransferase